MSAGSWFHSSGFSVGEERGLLERYLDVGPERLAREIEGFVVVVIGDARTQDIHVITDVIGSCHAFVRTVGRTTVVAGSSMLLAGLAPYALDPTGCREFLDAGVIYEDRTVYREVRKLGPATVHTLHDGTLKHGSRYWRLSDIGDADLEGPVATQ
jgi:hypothetical protein